MKKNIIFCLTILAIVFSALAYQSNHHEFSFPASGATNNIRLDVRDTSQVGINIYYIASLGNGTVASITLTNVGTSNSFALTNVLIGVTNVFLFTNGLPVTNLGTFSETNSKTYVTDANPTDTFVTFNTNTFSFTNIVGPQYFTVITSNLLGFTNAIATNVAYAGATNYLKFTATNGGPNSVTFLITNVFTVTNSGWTNVSVVTELNYITFTNATNFAINYLATNATATASTTNLYNAMAALYGNAYYFAYGSPTNFTLTTPLSPTYTATIGATLGTITLTTNSIGGNIGLICSNSFDGVRWYYDAAHTLSFPLGVGTTNYVTNWTSIGSFQYWQYTVSNAVGNNAAITYFDLLHGIKDGL